MIGMTFRFVVGILLLPATVVFVVETIILIAEGIDSSSLSPLLVGSAIYFTLAIIILKKDSFLEVFEHELGHALAALLLLGRVEHLAVKYNGVSQVGAKFLPGCSFFFLLAPYFLPVFTIPFVFLRFWVRTEFVPIVDGLIGFSLAFHYVRLWRQYGLHQTDIQKTGLVFSLMFIPICNLVILVFILGLVVEEPEMFLDFLNTVIRRCDDLYNELYIVTKDTVSHYGY